jgi:acetylornithine deacetylase/succinyl-diaminopimelate desuccinylase-like protein
MARLLLALEARTFPQSAAPYFERFRTVVTPGTMIEGGVSVNIVPEQCEALIDIRTTPEHAAAGLEAWFAQAAAAVPGVAFTFERLHEIPAVCSNPDAAIFRILSEVTREVRGIEPTRTVAGPANEGYLLIEQGIPTVCGFGPTGGNAHAADEYLDVAGLIEAAQIFARTAYRLSREMDAMHDTPGD